MKSSILPRLPSCSLTPLLMAGLLMGSCRGPSQDAEIQEMLSAIHFEEYSVAFASHDPAPGCEIIGRCPDRVQKESDSLRRSGKRLAFFVAESTFKDQWSKGYTSYLSTRLSDLSKTFRFAMDTNATVKTPVLEPFQIHRDGYELQRIASCEDWTVRSELERGAPKEVMFGECVQFGGIRCDAKMERCLVTMLIFHNRIQGMSNWLFMEKTKGRWKQILSHNKGYWE